MRTYSGNITKLDHRQIFVFGSNTEGRHGKGAAKVAMRFGAVSGKPMGLYGQTYGIITKDLTKQRHPSVSQHNIESQIGTLYYAAETMPFYDFLVAYNAAGVPLNGYTAEQMAAMFKNAGPIPGNIIFEEGFAKLIESA